MLERLPTMLTAQEILDKAFLKANKLEIQDPDKYHRIRKTSETQMKAIADITSDTLDRLLRRWPTIDDMSDYEQEVLDIVAGIDRLKQAISRVQWARDKIREVYRAQADHMRRERTIEGIKGRKRQASGRIASILDDVDDALAILAEVRDTVRPLPTIHPGFATVVIAGFPNVGKSTLLTKWTNADPEIAGYAFTTKQAYVGHMDVKYNDIPHKIQFVDTPGLLDRPEGERNDVERQAVAALRHAADAILFIVDPSGTSGFSPADQEQLLADTRKRLAGIPFIVAESKSDLLGAEPEPPQEGRIRISVHTGEGLDELQKVILQHLPLDEPVADEDPLSRWQHREEEFF